MGRDDTKSLAVGTRTSALAIRQTEIVVDFLRSRFPEIRFTIVNIQTKGDAAVDQPIAEIGDKGVFVDAIELALVNKNIDLAIHSLKDVPADLETESTVFAAFPVREDPRDVLVSRTGDTLHLLPSGARIGTSSLRRRVQLLDERPDVQVLNIRGNVDTRLRKLDDGQYDAVLLAAAGLRRLGLADRITEYLAVERFLPDAGQGILAVRTRRDDRANEVARAADDPVSRAAATAERALVRALGAGCQSPVGALAEIRGNRLFLRGLAATEDGSRIYREQVEGPFEQSAEIGTSLGERLLAMLTNGSSAPVYTGL